MKELIRYLKANNIDFSIGNDILVIDNIYSVPGRDMWGKRTIGTEIDNDYYYIKDNSKILINNIIKSSMVIKEIDMLIATESKEFSDQFHWYKEDIVKKLYTENDLNQLFFNIHIKKGSISIGTKTAFRNLEMEKLLYEGVHTNAGAQHESYNRTWIDLSCLKNKAAYSGLGYTYFVTQDGKLLRYSQKSKFANWKEENLIPIEVSCWQGIRVDNPVESW